MICSAWRPPPSVMRWSLAERRADVALVDGVGQLPRRHAAGLAEERLDVVDPEAGAGAERADQRGQHADEALRVVAEPLGDALGGRLVEAEARGRHLLVDPPGQLSAGADVDDHPAAGGHRLGQRLGDAPARPHEHERGRGQRVGQVVDQRRDLGGLGEHLDVAPDDHAPVGQERRGLRRVDEGDDRRVGGVGRGEAVAADLLDGEPGVEVTGEGVDDPVRGVAEQHLVVALDQVHGRVGGHVGHGRSRPASWGRRAASTAPSTSATRRLRRTSAVRRSRHPSATASDSAASASPTGRRVESKAVATPAAAATATAHRHRARVADDRGERHTDVPELGRGGGIDGVGGHERQRGARPDPRRRPRRARPP